MNTRHSLLAFFLLATPLTLPAAGPPRFRAVDVDTQIQIGYGVAVADVNGDKKPDILLADKNLIVWYENPDWKKHVIAEKLTAQDHVCIAAADIDGDGKCEVAVGAGWNPSDTVNSGALFYMVPAADRTQKWTPVKLPHEPTVHRIRWAKNAEGKYDLISVPLHGRGNNANTGEGAGVKILALKMPANPRDPWTTKLLDKSLHKTHNFEPLAATVNPGSADELLIASKEGAFMLLGNWKMQLGGPERGGAGEIRRGRNAAGRKFIATIEPMHGTNLVVYLGPQEHVVLDSSLVDGHALACGDLDGSAGDEIVVGWRAMGKPGARVGIKLFTAQDKEGTKWASTLVDDNTMACEDLCLADLDADGRLDIIAAGRATKNVKVYFNQGVP